MFFLIKLGFPGQKCFVIRTGYSFTVSQIIQVIVYRNLADSYPKFKASRIPFFDCQTTDTSGKPSHGRLDIWDKWLDRTRQIISESANNSFPFGVGGDDNHVSIPTGRCGESQSGLGKKTSVELFPVGNVSLTS